MEKFIFHLIIIFEILNIFIYSYKMEEKNPEDKNQLYEKSYRNMVHFIKCGSSDSILIESNGRFGLVDSSNPYKYIQNEVESVDIDESKGERHQWVEIEDQSVQAVLNYLDYLKVPKLDFIIGTHSHSDHIGGIPAIAYNYVDSNTKYYYREYRKNLEDTINIDWANYKYYLAAVHSMKKKGAELIEVTNKIIKFDFGEFHLELLNTDIDPDELNLGENQNCIVTLVRFGKTKLFLAADMISKDDKKIKDYLGKIDILKISHHGYSESSYDFISTVKPDYVIICNRYIETYANGLITFMKDNYGTTTYLTHNVPGTTEIIEKSAILLNFVKEEKEFYFINTGNEVKPDTKVNKFFSWEDKFLYIEYGKIVKGWKEIESEKGKEWFYFNEEGIMLIGWQKLFREGETYWFYFDKKNGNMLTGWQTLEKDGKENKYYFLPDNGGMVQNKCINIDNNNYCFDNNGCLIIE